MNGLASVLRWKGDYAGAEALLRKIVEFRVRVLGADHPETLGAQANLALTLSDGGSQEGAAALAEQVWTARIRVLGGEHPVTLASAHTLATIQRRRGRLGEAETLLAAAIEAAQRVLAPTHPSALLLAGTHGEVLALQKKFDAAVVVLRATVAQREKTGSNGWLFFADRAQLGFALAGQGSFAEAEPHLLAGAAGLAERESNMPASQRYRRAEVRAGLVELYERWGRPAEAAKWR